MIKANAAVGVPVPECQRADTWQRCNARDCVPAAMFWAKTCNGLARDQNIDHTTGGEPIQPSVIEIVAPKLLKIELAPDLIPVLSPALGPFIVTGAFAGRGSGKSFSEDGRDMGRS